MSERARAPRADTPPGVGAGSRRRLRALAPAKINLGLLVGAVRASDGRHELVSVMQSISLADELTLEQAPARGEAAGTARREAAGTTRGGAAGTAPAATGAGCDELVCAGVPGDPGANLAARALALFRERTGWDAPRQRLSVVKRIPLAAGLAGGSADAAAALRLAAYASGVHDEALLAALAAELGADVPAQVAPGRWLATGAGERLQQLRAPRATLGVLVVPVAAQLSTAAVYAQADRIAERRGGAELERLSGELAAALAGGEQLPPQALLVNDLQTAALQLCPQIAHALEQVRAAGAAHALVSGSGPTVLGLFPSSERQGAHQRNARAQPNAGAPAGGHGPTAGDGSGGGGERIAAGAPAGGDGPTAARRAAQLLAARSPRAICAVPVDARFAQVRELSAAQRC